MTLFYLPDIEPDELILPEEESRHIARVLRMKEGDRLNVTDGRGGLCESCITTIGKKSITLNVESRQTHSKGWDFNLHIAIAPLKSMERFEWYIEKATEIGIDRITPILTENSERKVLRPDRLEKVMISAMKQSLKVFKPLLEPLTEMADFLEARKQDTRLFMAYCGEGEKSFLKDLYRKGEDVIILIGPEGDFSPEEVESAMEVGYQTVTLGRSRLRTETAGIVACHSLHMLNH